MSCTSSPKRQTDAIDWRLQARMHRCILGGDMDDHDRYGMLGSAGASALEALEALDALLAETPAWAKAAILDSCLPCGLALATLRELLQRHGIHPLSVAVDFQDRRRAARFLHRLGVGESFGGWIGLGGQFLLRDPSIRSLPHGLVLRGWPQIVDCPELVDLGDGLTILVGNPRISD